MNDIIAVLDVSKCIDCRCCVISCKDEYALNDYAPFSAAMPFRGQKWVHIDKVERGTWPRVKASSLPILCVHCDDAPCVKAATGGAVYKRPDGIVIIDPVKSKGQKQIVDSCPYGVIFWNEEKEIPQKCTFCVHRLEKGELPRCMAACAGEAIKIGERSALMFTQGQIHWTEPEVLHPHLKTLPRVYYLGLPRAFITGALVDSKTGDCLEGADITLKGLGGTRTAKSDAFGDFWFDGLDAKVHNVDEHDQGATVAVDAEHVYELTITKGSKTKTMQVSLVTDTNLGANSAFE
jgi:Fe-S-cluster-containing dehydrogenase component